MGMKIVFAIFGVSMLVACLVGPFYVWSEWHGKIYKAQIPARRRVMASIGLFAVTTQAILFVGIWILVRRGPVLLGNIAVIELLMLLPVILSLFAWERRARWLLLASSVSLCIISSFAVLALIAR
jgi:hypothetical protein